MPLLAGLNAGLAACMAVVYPEVAAGSRNLGGCGSSPRGRTVTHRLAPSPCPPVFLHRGLHEGAVEFLLLFVSQIPALHHEHHREAALRIDPHRRLARAAVGEAADLGARDREAGKGSQHQQVPGLGCENRGGLDAFVEGHQSRISPRSERQQVKVSEVTGRQDLAVIESRRIAEADIIGPKFVIFGSGGIAQSARDVGDGKTARIRGLRDDADARILRQRAGGPALGAVPNEPLVRWLMMNVGGIKQGDEHVRIKECNHGLSESSISF